MDAFAVAALCREWEEKYAGARIDKVHQPAERDVVLTVRGRSGTARLLLSAHRNFPRAHELTLSRPVNPPEPPMFCMRLRKYLEGGKIVQIRQQGFDRVMEVLVEHMDELGDLVLSVLVLEMMGKHSNLILCTADGNGQPQRVIDSIVHVTPAMSRVRPMLPGVTYTMPPAQDKRPWRDVTEAELNALGLSELTTKAQSRALCGFVTGLGPVTAAEAIHRAARSEPRPDTFGAALVAALREVCKAALTGAEGPHLGLDDLGRPAAAAPFRLTAWPTSTPVASLSLGLEQLYAELTVQNALSQATSDLVQLVQDWIDKLRGKVARLREELAASQQHETWRIKGELLTAYASQVQKGMRVVELPNYYDEGRPLAIELDPALGPIENAQRYFKMSSRHKRVIPALQAELTQATDDIRYLEEVLVHLRDASPTQVEQIRTQLEEQGFVRARHAAKRGKKQPAKAEKPDVYVSSDGFLIRVGRNNVQNDRLTLRSSQPHDIWLHVKDQPGSHVVIETQRREVPERTLEEAALLATYFSKARDDGNVPVDYTLVKNVWKPSGARPGHVLYEGYKTLYVTPDRRLIEPLLKTRRQPASGHPEEP